MIITEPRWSYNMYQTCQPWRKSSTTCAKNISVDVCMCVGGWRGQLYLNYIITFKYMSNKYFPKNISVIVGSLSNCWMFKSSWFRYIWYALVIWCYRNKVTSHDWQLRFTWDWSGRCMSRLRLCTVDVSGQIQSLMIFIYLSHIQSDYLRYHQSSEASTRVFSKNMITIV